MNEAVEQEQRPDVVSAEVGLVLERVIQMVGELERRQMRLEAQNLELHQEVRRLLIELGSLEHGVTLRIEKDELRFKQIAVSLAKLANWKQVKDTGVRN